MPVAYPRSTTPVGCRAHAIAWLLLAGAAAGFLACGDAQPSGAVLCVGVQDGTSCDDGAPCTANDRCTDGVCLGAPAAHEAYTCDGLDEDCDGVTDEDCTFRLTGHVLGGGAGTGTATAGQAVDQAVSTPTFVGLSSNDSFVLTPGLPGGSP